MGVATGCGCKEVYRFPHTYLSLLLLYLFFFYSIIPTFVIYIPVDREIFVVTIFS